MDKYLGTLLDGRYEILEVIGVGGMATVYKARDNRLNRFVAVKILKDDLALDADFRRRFQTESQAAAMLSSPNIVAVYDVSKSVDVEYIVMELIEGITLKQYMNRKGKLSWKEAFHFATQITRALSHAHSRGIIHRDIKPHNIMILKDGSVKVADFGIARLQDSKSSTLTQEALGSVHYISPEQAKGVQVDSRSDLYSVGVVLYEMLTSRLPFEGDTAVSVAIQHISSIPLSPREINPEIPAGLEDITMKAMNPSLNLRYQTADDMLRDFEEFRKNPAIVFPFAAAAAGAAGAGVVAANRGAPGSRQVPPDGARGEADRQRKRPTKEQERENHHRRNKKAKRVSTMLGVGVVLLVLVGIFIWLWSAILGGIFADPVRIDVDDFLGRHIEDVLDDEEYLEIYDFTVEYVETDDHPEGTIIGQNPRAGRSVSVDSDGLVPITLTVAIPADLAVMPDLFNMTYEQARMRLGELGIPLDSIQRRDEASDSIMENHVVSTIPVAGDPLPERISIFLFISTGPEDRPVRVPNMHGNTLSVAISTLQALGLDWETVEEFNNAASGTVIGQSHAANSEVPQRTRIVLTVSRGPEPVPSPSPSPSPPPSPSPSPSPSPTPDENGEEETE